MSLLAKRGMKRAQDSNKVMETFNAGMCLATAGETENLCKHTVMLFALESLLYKLR